MQNATRKNRTALNQSLQFSSVVTFPAVRDFLNYLPVPRLAAQKGMLHKM